MTMSIRSMVPALLSCFVLHPSSAEELAHTTQGERDRTAAVRFQADHWSYADLEQTSVLTGKVTLRKGNILLKADQVRIHRNAQGYDNFFASAKGTKLVYFRQKRSDSNQFIEARGRQIEYDSASGVTTIRGQASVRRLLGLNQTLDQIEGAVIRYDTLNSLYSADSAPGSNSQRRVRAMLMPRVQEHHPEQTVD